MTTTFRPQRILRWTAMIGGGAVAVVIGLLASETISAAARKSGHQCIMGSE